MMNRIYGHLSLGIVATAMVVSFWPLGQRGSARAYIPPSAFLVKSMSAKRAGYKAIRVRSEVTAMDNDKPTAVRFTEITEVDPKEGVIKCRGQDETGRDLYVIERRISDLPPGGAVLFEWRPLELALALKQNGVPIRTEADLLALKDEPERRASETEFLTRWNGGYAWVIGKRNPDKSDAQLWVEKDSFAPIRIVKGDEDIRMDRYRLFREFPYPRVITLYESGKSVLQDEVAEVAINGSTAPGWWGGGTAAVGAANGPGFTALGDAAPSPLKDLIQKYFERIR